MSYTTEATIEAEFKSIDFSSNTSVTSTDISNFIAEIDAYIDSRLSLKYEVPITNATDLLIIKTIATYLVADRVRKILAVKSGDGAKDQSSSKGEKSAAEKMLDYLVEEKMVLVNSTRSTSHGGVKSYNYDNDIDTSIDVTLQQW